MTSPGPTASEEPLGSALAIAMTLFVFAAQSFRRACSGRSAGYEMLATKFVAVNAVRPAEKAGRAAAGHAAGQPGGAPPATFGRPNAASIARRTFTARSLSSQSTSLQRQHRPA